MHKPNSILESDVRGELAWDPLVDDGRIVVKAHDGRVTLTGAVGSYPELTRALEDASKIRGVTHVDNELLVGSSGEDVEDATVLAACLAALDADKQVPKGSVSVSVADGFVSLGGEVHHHFQVTAAKRAVGRVAGVRAIYNNIAISSDPIPSDVADRIKKAFRRNAIIDDSLIDVSSSGHTIYLDGTVRSWAALRQAENVAWNATGVSSVVDRLVIEP